MRVRPASRRTLAVLAVFVAINMAAVAAPPAAASPTPPATTPTSPTTPPADPVMLDGVGSGPHTITLVTGDKVTLSSRAAEGPYQVDVDRTPRPDGTIPEFTIQSGPDGVYVLPFDAMPAIRAGRVDRELFDVKYLAEHGYTDAQTAQVPVIVQYPDGKAAKSVSAAAAALPASTPTHQLDSIHGAALNVTKKQAGTFWTAVRGTAPAPGQPPTAAATTLRGGIAKVWLDRKATVTLDQSVPLIGAPQAWAAGHDGTGVKVAVLDTGIDAAHPDLAGKVAESRSFVPGEEVADGHGHGTHVAATIAGSGAAANAARKGVAPGAQLVVGKVLSNAGEGQESWIIEGMEWAANSGAAIVSMSLGGNPTDGSDPMSQAVDDLTAATGTLFVIAAGNAGADATIGTPGAAAAALTVAATDKADKLAAFSSRGPRKDGGLKPDIAAPGADIVAARAAGTAVGTPVDELYTSASGTSMATPHVAGAAAILVQQHPEWTAVQLKSALMSTSKDTGYTGYQQGAGRVDIAKVDQQRVLATTPNLDFGSQPLSDQGSVSRQVTYTNLTDQPVTLTLTTKLATTKGTGADDALRADPTVTVPAGGTATATATVDLSKVGEGTYTGTVVATAGDLRLTTPVGLIREPQKFTLTVRTIGRSGAAEFPYWHDVIDVADSRGRVPEAYGTEVGVIVQHVPAGVYSVTQMVGWVGADSRMNYAWLFAPEVRVTGDTEIVVDARRATQISFRTPRPAEPINNEGGIAAYQRTDVSGQTFGFRPIMGNWGSWQHLWATPTKPVTVGKFRFHHQWTLGKAEVAMRIQGRRGLDLHAIVPARWEKATPDGGWVYYQQVSSNGWTNFPDRDFAVVDAGAGLPADIAGRDLRGKLALVESVPDYVDTGECYVPIDRIERVRDAGAAGLLFFSANRACAAPLGVGQEAFKPARPARIANVSLSTTEGLMLRERLTKEPVTIQVSTTSETPYTYVLSPYEDGRIPDSLQYTFTDRQLARVDLNFHSAKPTRVQDWRYTWKQDDAYLLGTGTAYGAMAFAGPRTRPEYVGPLYPDVFHEKGAGAGESFAYATQTRGYLTSVHDRPARTSQHFFADPHTPGPYVLSDDVYAKVNPDGSGYPAGFCTTCRQGNTLVIRPTDVAPNRGDRYLHLNPDDREIKLSKDGVDITAARISNIRLFPLPDGPGNYRLTARDADTSATWTFASSPPTKNAIAPGHTCLPDFVVAGNCRPEPLVYVSYDLGDTIDLHNTVSTRGRHTFRVNAFHERSAESMPEIAGLKLWTSTDDGRTWTPVHVARSRDGSFTVTTRYPHYGDTTGTVSLKVEAWDKAGNRLEQTTLRAFHLRPTHRNIPVEP